MGLLDGFKKMVGATDPSELLAFENDKQLKIYMQNVDKINALEEDFEKLSNDQLRAKTDYLKARLQSGGSIESILVEAFAVVREAAWRVLELRHYDVQVISNILLSEGRDHILHFAASRWNGFERWPSRRNGYRRGENVSRYSSSLSKCTYGQ